MNIRPKNMILYADTGVKFSQSNLGGANWRQQVFNNYRQRLLDQLAKYGESDNYGQWLNEMQSRHSQIYNLAGGKNRTWENTAYRNNLVGQYQHDYKGDQRFGIQLNPEDNYNFNQGITPNYNTRYNISNPPKRTSGDSVGQKYNVDNLYSAITDDRRILGREGDWDETSLREWNNQLNKVGWETYLDSSDNYYKIRRLPKQNASPAEGVQLTTPTINTPKLSDLSTPWAQRFKFNIQRPESEDNKTTQVEPKHKERYGFDWSKIGKTFTSVLGNPNVLAFGRLAGNLINNERVFDEQIKGINPDLKSSYHTYRQVVGDEATKQGYYRRAAQGQTKAAQPFTSDADRQMAYQFEQKRVGDELRAQGDLADNQMIQKTSDEANQHAWANTQRDTEVANVNRASINQANALKHNLLAQKHSAQWSSIDNFLQGIEYRKRQGLAEQQAINDQIFTLRQKHALQNDPRLLNAQKEFQAVLDKHKTSTGYDQNDPEVLKAKRKYQGVYNQLAIEQYQQLKDYYKTRNSVFSAKSGTKITHKKKDDLLYKSARDVVEHFRKMSKISSDAQNRKKPKIEKLAPHPKGKTRSYQQGGVAPFTIYKPVALGGETTTSSEASTSRTAKSSKDSDGLDLLKELFKSLQTEGLPSDVNGIYMAMQNLLSKQQMFGNELSTEDIASMYIQQMQQINNVKFFKKQFDDVQKIVNEKDAGSEFAIDQFGRVAVQDKEGKVSYMKWSELRDNLDKYNPLHNNDILNLRALSPSNAFDSDLLQVASNATSMSEIAKFLKAQLPNIGQSEKTIEGYTKKDSNDIKEGLKLLKDAPAGDYKYSEYTKEQQNQAKMALGYLKSILPKNMKTLLEVNSEIQGVSSDAIISAMIGSTLNENYRLEFDAVTGKAAKDSNGNSKLEGSSENSAGLAFVLGQGPRELIDFNTGSSVSARVLGIKGVLQTKSKENLGQGATLQDATKSQQGGYLQWNKATFGGSRLNAQAYSHIILNDSTIMGMDLPYTKDINGNEIPDFQMLKKVEQADQEISINNIEDLNQINSIYQKYGLPPKYDQNGNLNKINYKRFAAIQVTLDEQSLQNKDAILSDEVILAGEVERDLYNEAMKKSDKNYDLSDGMWITGWGKDQLYKGTVFIPYDEDIAFAALSSGEGFKQDLPDNAKEIQLMQYAEKAKTYKAPDINLTQLKNN